MNNFDQSSSGIDITFDIFRDCFRSLMDFNDMFERLPGERRLLFNGIPLVTWLSSDDFNFFEKPEESSEADILFTLRDWVSEEDYEDMVNDFFDLQDKLTFERVVERANESMPDDLFNEWREAVLIPLYHEIQITGFSQGDSATVFVPFEAIKGTQFGEEVDKGNFNPLRQFFENVVYSAPVTTKLQVFKHGSDSEIEFHLDKDLKDQYKCDEDEIIEILKSKLSAEDSLTEKDREYIVEWVKDAIPDTLDYIR